MEYLFIIGRASKLCQVELEAVLKAQKINYHAIFISAEIFHLETSSNLNTDGLIKTLGGTIKIAKVEKKLALDQDEQLRDEVVALLLRSNEVEKKKLTFGFSGYGGFSSRDLSRYSGLVKEKLEEKDLLARFVLSKEGATLSSVVVVKQHVLEIILVLEKDKIVIAKTLAVSDFEDWGKRDFGRPCSDARSGMLPPKVARMMVNLASQGDTLQKPIVLDPFCGVGTILGEAMTMGYEVIGSDQNAGAVEKSRKNLQWIISEFKVQSSKFKVCQMDATHLSEKIAAASINAIVTEPYLGPSDVMLNSFQHPQRILNQVQNDEKRKLENIITGLDKLYLGCLREWRKILKPGGIVVMAFPSFKSPAFAKASAGKEFFVKKALDSCEGLGYTLEAGPYQYARPQAVVRRNIYILKISQKSKVKGQKCNLKVKSFFVILTFAFLILNFVYGTH